MNEQTQLAELLGRWQAGTPDIRRAMLAAGEIQPAKAQAAKTRMGTVRDAAACFEPPVCPRTVERLAKKGAFPRVVLSARTVRYPLDAVLAFAQTGAPAAGSEGRAV
jgi:hypothetical protein